MSLLLHARCNTLKTVWRRLLDTTRQALLTDPPAPGGTPEIPPEARHQSVNSPESEQQQQQQQQLRRSRTASSSSKHATGGTSSGGAVRTRRRQKQRKHGAKSSSSGGRSVKQRKRRAAAVAYWLLVLVPWLLLALVITGEVCGYKRLAEELDELQQSLHTVLQDSTALTTSSNSCSSYGSNSGSTGVSDAAAAVTEGTNSCSISSADVAAVGAAVKTRVLDQAVAAYAKQCFALGRALRAYGTVAAAAVAAAALYAGVR
jgi:hypothetical protein